MFSPWGPETLQTSDKQKLGSSGEMDARCRGITYNAPISVKPDGGGGGVGHRVGILTFSKRDYQNPPPPGKKALSKLAETNGLLLFYYIKLKDQMHRQDLFS